MAQSFINYNDKNAPLGFKNNNPTNLIENGTTWEGKIGSSKGFVVFDDVAWGIRAAATNLHSSITRSGTDTIRKYISRFAPPNENDTEAYIRYVSTQTGIGENDKIPTDVDSVKKILRAQMQIEIGQKYSSLITEDDMNEGLSRLSSPVASFFSAAGVFYSQNKKSVNYGVIGIVLVSVLFYIRYLKKQKIV
jgi:hypothetical protein